MKRMKIRPRRLTLFLIASVLLCGTGRAEIITIMAANITSGNYSAYESPGIRIFQGLKPDIVLIQEFNYESGTLRQLVDQAFGPEYYYYVEPGTKQIPNGVVSRWPFKSKGYWNDVYQTNREFVWAVIDIPGEIDLQVVSVHLSSDPASERANQASNLKSYIQANFDDGKYIVVGGDINCGSAGEQCILTLNSFLHATSHRPVDQNGNADTNEPRTKPYDWLMPNDQLDWHHTTLTVGSSSYPQGLVFDSHVYTPLSEASPVQYGDSHVFGMQHMAVMKAFDISISAPSPTPPPPPTPIPSPTSLPPVINSGDYNGDGTSEIAVFRSSYGVWLVRGFTAIYFGNSTDIPAPGDYDGDGTTNVGTFRPSSSLWAIRDFTRIYLGTWADRPAPADYNGDGRCDVAILRPDVGLWAVRDYTRAYFGMSGDQPVPRDYDGDGAEEIAIFRGSTGKWAIRNLSTAYFGGAGDFPAAEDYDGDGSSEIAIFRSYYGLWGVRDFTRLYFGISTDRAVPADFSGDHTVEFGIFRPSNGYWSIRAFTSAYYGGADDVPVTR